MTNHTSWTAQQLTEFVAAVSSASDERHAVRDALERAAEAFEAEVGAMLGGGEVVASTGFGVSEVPAEELAAIAAGESDTLSIAGIGECMPLTTPIDDD